MLFPNPIVQYLVAFIGWTSATAFVTAYILISRGKLNATSGAYQILNIAGAVDLGISNSGHGSLPSATLNLVWCLVGVHALATRFRR